MNKLQDMKRLFFFSLLLLCLKLQSQDQTNPYQTPSADLVDLVNAPPSPSVLFTRNGGWMIIQQRQAMMDIADLAQPELRIGGLRINPATFSQSRIPFIVSLKLKESRSGREYDLEGLPENPKFSFVRLSPDEQKLAFIHQSAQGNELWVADLKTRKTKRWSNVFINSSTGNPYQWVHGAEILAKAVREGKQPPRENPVPPGPVIQETEGVAAPAATFQDLLKNPFDEALFEYYCSVDLVRISAEGTLPVSRDLIAGRFDLSPDKKYILLHRIKKPFSYLVPYSRFATQIEILDLSGKTVRILADNPPDEVRPRGFDAASRLPRNFQWRDDLPATICWVQALDEGDPKKKVEFRDALQQLEAPFSGSPLTLYQSGMRLQDVYWSDKYLAFAREGLFATRQILIKKFNPFLPDLAPDTLFAYSSQDAYNDPGEPVLAENQYHRQVVMTNPAKNLIYTIGKGASPDGDMPFLSSFDLKSKKQEILWRCKAPYYEYPVHVIDLQEGSFITSRESQTENPNYYLRNYKGLNPTALTSFPNPQPQLANLKKEKIEYQRADGLNLTAVLYTPKGYDKTKSGPLPVLMWAYPREYKSASDAAQVRGSKYSFTRITYGSPVFWALRGYAVMDQTEMPIVGSGDEEPNDTYIDQLVKNAEAAVEKISSMGIGDKNRIGVGGHSYGAFMTANLLAHSDLFAAGIARSGAYNRTLTPFGFQNEQRSFWEAPEVYHAMSPFSHADKIKEPILLIHGEADNNTGTFPMQSERLFHAIKENGGTARLVMLPHESHGYAAKESIYHMLYEMDQWLEKNVKNAGVKSTKPKS